MQAAYDLMLPDQRTTSVVFASPHSGRDYPRSFLRKSVLDERTIRSSEDAFVDLLFASATDVGSPLLAARAPRAFIDLNRSAEELDPALIGDVPPGGRYCGYPGRPRVEVLRQWAAIRKLPDLIKRLSGSSGARPTDPD